MKLARSPYIIEIAETGQEGSKLELFLWSTGAQPTDPSYTLSKLIPATNKIETYYNISPYVREYFNFTSWQTGTGLTYGVDTSDNFIVNYIAKKYKLVGSTYTLVSTETGEFMDGYNYYMDGYNATTPRVLLDEGTYFYNYDASIPTSQGNGVWGSFDCSMNVGDVVRYTDLKTGATFTETATTESIKSFARVYLTYAANGNKVEFLSAGVTVLWTAYFKPQCEPKYQPVVIDFVNRYGSWSRIFFQKSKKRSIQVKTNEYKFNPKQLPYTSSDNGQYKEFNTNGKESIKLNTGWVNDNYSEYLQQLLLSERVHLLDYEVNTEYVPVKVKSKSLQKQTGLNDGMINYTLDFEMAFDTINTVL